MEQLQALALAWKKGPVMSISLLRRINKCLHLWENTVSFSFNISELLLHQAKGIFPEIMAQ